MSKALRLSEKWFRFGLWLVAFVFASFLIGLGGTVVRNLPQVHVLYQDQINAYDVVVSDDLVFTKAAFDLFVEARGQKEASK